MTTEQFRRHGDVYIIEAPGITADALRRKGQRVTTEQAGILAYGEVTGHKHELMAGTGTFERYELDGETYLIVGPEGISITHEEHGVGHITKGVHKVTIDREYDYIADMARNVAD
jgi:hypothetical protein